MVIYIVDTYAWIELIKGSEKGLILQRLLEDMNHKFITMECCIAELKGFALKNKISFRRIYEMVKSNSIVLPVLIDHWLAAAGQRYEMRKTRKGFGLIDSILLAKQQELKCKLISGDSHFKGLKNVVYLE